MDDDKYRGIYRIPPARWRDWDYGANAAYYVTVCTAHRERFFGEIVATTADVPAAAPVETQNLASLPDNNPAPQMQLSEIGRVAHDCWTQIPAHFPFAVPDAFVIMPNHVHGIIIIDKPDNDSPPLSAVTPVRMAGVSGDNARIPAPIPVETQNLASLQSGDATPTVQTQNLASLPNADAPPQSGWQPNKFGPQSRNLASIIRGFKSAVTKFAAMNSIPFAWQTCFHDRVIRDYDEYARIAQYINTNIENWKDDDLYE
jgi:REP element-mobilizing transposase RayT